jgi:UDP-N-acetylglucosamine/UDP-N-acetylgalactosamine diphosphorylase
VDKSQLVEILKPHDQVHLLHFWDELSPEQQSGLSAQIQSIDWEQLKSLSQAKQKNEGWGDLAARADVPPAITAADFKDPASYEEAYQLGAQALKEGKVGFILVAGGQGSRLGFDNPKGMYPIGPVSNRTLYQMMIEQAHARAKQFETSVPIYVMSSPPTHEASEKFLTENNWFGYPKNDIRIFCQGVMAAIDNESGRALLADQGEIFVSPDGHGGTLGALERSGCLADMESRGVEHVFYGQIDNPLLQVCNPALIGYHIKHKSEMTTQVVRKQSALQKVGNVVSVDGVVQIIEYSDLPEEFARQTNEDGSLKLWAGSIAVHVFDREFLQSVNDSADGLPFHQAHKKVAYVNESGERIEPQSNNAIKFERFIFDLLPKAKNAIVCEVNAAEGFAAVKNAPPAETETPDWVKAAICNLHRSWIEQAGGKLAADAIVEISPFFAAEPGELAGKSCLDSELTGAAFLE